MSIHTETAVEYFRRLVELAIQHQHLESTELSRCYLVNLLCGYVGSRREDDLTHPLALRLARSLEATGHQRTALLRGLGDVSLFVSGYFSDHLNRRIVDVDYYVSMGALAYAEASRLSRGTSFEDVYSELSQNFVGFADVLCEVSESSGSTNSHDILRLYERWLRTKSSLAARKLAEHGVVPIASIRWP